MNHPRHTSTKLHILLATTMTGAFAADPAHASDPLPAFTTRIEISANFDFPFFVRTVDFNGDGHVDVIAADQDVLRLYLNDGAAIPNFEESIIAETFGGLKKVAIADLDGDGDLDFAVTASAGTVTGWFWIHENMGGTPPVFDTRLMMSGKAFRWVEIADLNDDGALDIIVASSSDHMVRCFLQNPDALGEYTEVIATDEYSEPYNLAIADMNGDGHLDIVVGGYEVVRWLENTDGSATEFVSHDVFTIGPGSTTGMMASVIDFDGDDRPDLLSAWEGSGALRVHHNLGGDPPVFETFQIGTAPEVTSAFGRDMDGDGLTDVVSASRDTDVVSFWRNLGTEPPNFSEEKVTTAADLVQSVAAGDLDGDGDLDIVSASAHDDSIRWYRNDSDVSPRIVFRPHAILDGLAHPNGMVSGDFNNDGRLDIVTGELFTGVIRLFRNQGGDPLVWAPINITPNASQPNVIVAADLNNDGRLDLVIRENGMYWRRNNGGNPPTFTEFQIGTTIHTPENIVDFDGDGWLDIVTRNNSSALLFRSSGGHTPEFTLETLFTTEHAVRSSGVGDLNGDGDLDVILGSTTGIRWYEQLDTTPPSFVEHAIQSSSTSTVHEIVTADFDQDGDIDIASYRSNGAIVWHENVSNGGDVTFVEHGINPPGGSASYNIESLIVADVDGDVHPDLISSSDGGDGVRWHHFNLEAPSKFVTHIVSAERESTWSVVGDFNADGQIDMASAIIYSSPTKGALGSAVLWHENLFRLPADLNDDGLVNGADLATLLSGWGPDTGFGADLNGDGVVNGADLAMLLSTWLAAP